MHRGGSNPGADRAPDCRVKGSFGRKSWNAQFSSLGLHLRSPSQLHQRSEYRDRTISRISGLERLTEGPFSDPALIHLGLRAYHAGHILGLARPSRQRRPGHSRAARRRSTHLRLAHRWAAPVRVLVNGCHAPWPRCAQCLRSIGSAETVAGGVRLRRHRQVGIECLRQSGKLRMHRRGARSASRGVGPSRFREPPTADHSSLRRPSVEHNSIPQVSRPTHSVRLDREGSGSGSRGVA